ncbi:chromosome segregation protein SMC [Clostridium vincentii]|uniref:Chromosome partition protein Smc n=1 Tax=Clostridium vincentii TaxID=52704 RepID=A0A2T0BJX2_9CLOT|nr:chromosome segregation protein SMC [Clostridium vincentii]PRR84174.1 Chromosome partition protein Smc [Clostridium vincentii]
MFLKSLEIRGFKSFADKTELKFKKGVTAVVGPNGSGKSNISDSVRWVLGEQSVKTLRGGKMEDVIFAGTQYRKAVGLAQVSLTLDNEDGTLSTDYNEVTVSRRIFRSGEAEYLINGSKCRLKDITQLFMDTGIGKEGYSLIGQGKIEAILSGKTEERRALLEEAAGIVKYKSRKEEAEKKLSNTDVNLIRIKDIISTYEERIEPLKIEREKALEYTEISNELKEKEVSLLVCFINEIEVNLKDSVYEVNSRQKDLNNKKKELQENKDKLRDLEEKIENINKITSEKKLEYYNRKELIGKINNDIEIYKERINNINANIEKNADIIHGVNIKIDLLKDEKLKAEKDLNDKAAQQELKEVAIKDLEEKSLDSINSISIAENEIRDLKEDEFEFLRGQSDIKNAITLINNDSKFKKDKKELFNLSLSSTEENIKINLATLEEIKERLQEDNSYVKGLEYGILEKKKETSILSTNITKKYSEVNLVNKSINQLEANKTILTNLEKHYEGYNRSVKVLMERIQTGAIKLADETKVVGEIFKVNKDYETAIEIALGAGISNVITEDEKIAKDLINYLKNNHLGRATFLPLNNIRGNKIQLDSYIKNIDGFIGIASEVISFSEKYEKAINNLLGRTIVCRDMDSALNISKKGNNNYRIVTLAGEIITPGGALTGGSIHAKHTNILSRKREIEEIHENLENKKRELAKISNELEALKLKLKTLDEEMLNNKDEVHFKTVEIAKAESQLGSLKNETQKLSYSLEISKGEKKRNEEDIVRLNKELKKKESELLILNGETFSNKEKVKNLESILQTSKGEISQDREKLTQLKVNKGAIDEILLNKISEVERIKIEIEENNSSVFKILKENEENNKGINNLNSEIILKFKEIKESQEIVETLESAFKEKEFSKEKFKEDFRIKDSVINESLDIINKEEAELNKRELQRAKNEMEMNNLYTKLNEELGLTLAEAVDIAVEVKDANSFKDNITTLKRKVTSLGIVNLAAIEEYEEIKEKYEFMSSQREDLEKAEAELLSVIGEMTDKMKILFRDNFKIINKYFNETFKELFKGGNAELILSEGDELTANIDINVELPGKKLQNINLMSGGEKVLSAIALLFAILKMKPTPFCILDEIEAALDDANVNRYAEFLVEFSKKIQFIVITHRKGTMEASDLMYGVTMEEKGVSKVVSVNLNR